MRPMEGDDARLQIGVNDCCRYLGGGGGGGGGGSEGGERWKGTRRIHTTLGRGNALEEREDAFVNQHHGRLRSGIGRQRGGDLVEEKRK